VSEFHTEAPQPTATEGLAQGPYLVGRAGFKPTIFQRKGSESTNEPPHPTIHNNVQHVSIMYVCMCNVYICKMHVCMYVHKLHMDARCMHVILLTYDSKH